MKTIIGTFFVSLRIQKEFKQRIPTRENGRTVENNVAKITDSFLVASHIRAYLCKITDQNYSTDFFQFINSKYNIVSKFVIY